MSSGSVLLLTGPPGSGKSTVARLVADRFEPAVCLECDWFWTTIVRGHIPPWLPEADAQNRAVVRAWAAASAELALAGYTVVVDGIIGPWFLDLVTAQLRRTGGEVHYVVLRPTLEVVLARAAARGGEERVPGHPALTEEEPHPLDVGAVSRARKPRTACPRQRGPRPGADGDPGVVEVCERHLPSLRREVFHPDRS